MRHLRVFSALVLAILSVAGMAWMVNHPGSVTVVWLGWRADVTVAAAACVFLLVLAAVLFLLWLVRWLFGGWIFGFFATRRQDRAARALSEGVAAVFADDAAAATRSSAIVRRAGLDTITAILLSAHAARMSGDLTTAKRRFDRLLDRPRGRLAALRAFTNMAEAAGDSSGAAAYATQAMTLSPGLGWAARVVISDQIATARWADGCRSAARARKAGALATASVCDDVAAALRAGAETALQGGEASAAARLVECAVELDPHSRSGRVLQIKTLIATQASKKKVARSILAAWKSAPHPDLAVAYLALGPDQSALARAARAEQLALTNPVHRESRLLVARAWSEARLWRRARTALEPVLAADPTDRHACTVMADIETAENSDPAAANAWLKKAAAPLLEDRRVNRADSDG